MKKLKQLFRGNQQKIFFIFLQGFILFLCANAFPRTSSSFSNTNYFFESLDVRIRKQLLEIRSTMIDSLSSTFYPQRQQNKELITLVSIDEKFFENESIPVQGLHRWYYAKALEEIRKSWAIVVWLDVFFENKAAFTGDGQRSSLLNAVFRTYDADLQKNLDENVILAWVYYQWLRRFGLPDPLFAPTQNNLGHVNSLRSSAIDNSYFGVAAAIVDQNWTVMLPLSYKVYEQYLNQQAKQQFQGLWIQTNIEQTVEEFTVKSWMKTLLWIPLNNSRLSNMEENSKYILNPTYISQTHPIKTISLYDVIHGNYDPADFANKIVFIWTTDIALNDIKESLWWIVPWVYFHINTLLSMLNQDFIKIIDDNRSFLIIMLFLILNMILLDFYQSRRSIWLGIWIIIGEVIWVLWLSLLISNFYLPPFNSWISYLFPSWTLISLLVLQILSTFAYLLLTTHFVKENMQKLFRLYVWEKITRRSHMYIDDDNLKIAQEENVSILFSDIKWFTELSESLSPSENVIVLNAYLEKMSEIISNHKWFIDKYIGDAIMAFWEWNTTTSVLDTAILQIQALEELNRQLPNVVNKDLIMKLSCRIWLHYGKVIVWDIWSSKHKLNYTIIGDNVNLASRLEGINKQYWTNIILTQELLDTVDNQSRYLYRKLDHIRVKGKSNSVVIYELLPLFKQDLSSGELFERDNFLKAFHDAVNSYFAGDFNYAKEAFLEARLIKTTDPVCELFINRCEELLEHPPIYWDWVWTYSEK